MASMSNPAFAVPARQPAVLAPGMATAPAAPVGTFAPGTKVQVGGHRVVIVRYLSEGGFAHVYLVRLPKPINGNDGAVLKRVAVPDKDALANMRTEVETMKKLRGQRYIVTYIDSHASQLKGGGYEVFLLMEYCDGGGLIDFMNTRLQNRLTEPEVLKIFSDAALGVACMHYLKPPLLHRDLKVENILITSSGTSRKYKLCDFGSAAQPRPAATSAAEGRLIEEDVQKHTTLQYRSPEMIDVYRKQPIDEKSDIWALGVLLYKLCYYKTPFEDQGQMAILNASFKFPGFPSFSDKLKKLIAGMLREQPQARPNIYQVVREVSLMRGTDVPIKDIYAGRTQSEARQHQRLPPSSAEFSSPPPVGVSKAPPPEERLSIPEVLPMRRGRPVKNEGDGRVAKPSPSPLRVTNGDPFSALDTAGPTDTTRRVDDMASKFPSMDEFSLLHESGDNFSFGKIGNMGTQPSKDISQRVTNALADDAFARPTHVVGSETELRKESSTSALPTSRQTPGVPDAAQASHSDPAILKDQADGAASRSTMVSTGTMTSPALPSSYNAQSSESRPFFRFPSQGNRSSSQPRASDASKDAAALLRSNPKSSIRPGLLDQRSKSQIGAMRNMQTPGNSSPSLEVDVGDPDLSRSRSANSKSRPSSLQIEPKRRSLRSRAHSKEKLGAEGTQSLLNTSQLSTAVTGGSDNEPEATKIDSNVAFLKAMEDEDPARRKEKRVSSGSKHIKRASMPSISLAGTKNLLAGRFGDAFRRFESNTSEPGFPSPTLSPDQEGYNLTPIAGSEATDGRSDDGYGNDESEAAPPEVRRELERRRLSQEEKRVAEAGVAYRQRLADGGANRKGSADGPSNARAASIQSKVKSLLDESGRGSPSPTKKPEGYGRFTDTSAGDATRRLPSPSPLSNRQPPPTFRVPPRKESLPDNPPLSDPLSSRSSTNPQIRKPSSSTRASAPPTPRPSAPPKPHSLRTGNHAPPSKPSPLSAKPLPSQPPQLQSSHSQPDQPLSQQRQAVPKPQPQPQYPPQPQKRSSNPYRTSTEPIPPPPVDGSAAGGDEDWESNFSKRYPTLAGLEMVETEINGFPTSNNNVMGSPPPQPLGVGRVKDV
ncbi:MAG: hypothetical protein Q9183_003839 [Haloplaca sp. 2 TL-2023]